MAMRLAGLSFKPVTPGRWSDLEELFGRRGACGGCWCIAWRLPRAQWVAQKGYGNRQALRRLVSEGSQPGILAYRGNRPVGWCAIAPRAEYPALDRSRVLKPVDEQPVWSITCLFVTKAERRRGLSVALLQAAVRYARSRGASIVEGYPTEPKTPLPDPFVWTGVASAFQQAGFREVVRRSPTRPIMRHGGRSYRASAL